MEEGGDVGLHAHGLGVDAQKQMIHGGVGCHSHLDDAVGLDAGLGAQPGHDGAEGFLDNSVLEPLDTAGLALLHNAVDDVGAIADLAIARGGLGQKLAGLDVGQDSGHGGGADVNGQGAGRALVPAGADVAHDHGFALPAQGDAHVELAFAQRGGQLAQHGVGDDHVLCAGFVPDRPGEALVVWHGVIQGGMGHGELGSEEGVFQRNTGGLDVRLELFKHGDFLAGAKVGRLHPALVGRGDVRHLHRHVRDDAAAAAEAPALVIFLLGDVAGGQGFEFSLQELYAAFAAGTVAGAGGVDGHIGLPRHGEKVGIRRHGHHHIGLVLKGKRHLKHEWGSFH